MKHLLAGLVALVFASDASAAEQTSALLFKLRGCAAKKVSRHEKVDFARTYRPATNGMLRTRDVRFDSFYGTAAILRR